MEDDICQSPTRDGSDRWQEGLSVTEDRPRAIDVASWHSLCPTPSDLSSLTLYL